MNRIDYTKYSKVKELINFLNDKRNSRNSTKNKFTILFIIRYFYIFTI